MCLIIFIVINKFFKHLSSPLFLITSLLHSLITTVKRDDYMYSIKIFFSRWDLLEELWTDKCCLRGKFKQNHLLLNFYV